MTKTMTMAYTITHNEGITKIKFLVKPSFGQTKSIIDEIVEKYPYEKRLWDLSEVDFDFTITEIRMIAEYGKVKFTKPNKLAIYAVKDLAFGEMRQFEVYREEENKVTPRVFRDEQSAIEWLNS